MKIIKGKVKRPQRVTLYGPEGIGKSTLASQFPDPLFIDTEGSTYQLDVARTPTPSSWQMLLQQVQYVKDNPGTCKTLIIDTADWAEHLAITDICARYKKSGIEEFGYGKGYVYLSEAFGQLLNLLNDVIEAGIHVVLTAHAHIRKFEQPDEAGAYDRWELKLQRRTAPLVKEWADMVLFLNYKTFVVNVDEQKGRSIAQGGKRVIHTTHRPAWDAKNRHGLPEELDLDYASIAHIFEDATPAPEPAPEPPVAEVAATEPSPEPEVAQNPLQAAGVPRALIDLMETNNVTLLELQEIVTARGYYPHDTPLANYEEGFIQDVLISAWPQVLAAIEKNRESVPF